MLSQLHIKGFKSICDYMFVMKPIVLLTGLNNAGKSTVLHALRMLFNAMRGDDPYLEGYGTFEDLHFQLSKINAETFISHEILFEIFTNDQSLSKITLQKEKEPQKIPQNNDKNSHFSFLSADRQGPVPFFRKYYPFMTGSLSCGTKGEQLYDCLQKFGEETLPDFLCHESKVGHTLRQNFTAWLNHVVGTSSNISLEDTPSSLDVASITVDGYRSVNVGFGVSYTMSVIVNLLTAATHQQHRCPTPHNHFLVAIENPEAHLHPRGQTEMGKLLALVAMSGVQIIVETHSDYIVDGVRLAVKEKLGGISADDALLYFFEKQDGESQIQKITIHESGKLSDWPVGFFDQGRRNKAKLLEG